MGFDVGTLGNHEFDEGGAEALRLAHLAHYPYVGANTVTPGRRRPDPAALQGRRARRREGRLHRGDDHRHAVLPALASTRASSAGPTSPTPSTATCPSCSARASRRSSSWPTRARSRRATTPTGEVVDEARQMDRAVDVVVAGHTHSQARPRRRRQARRRGALLRGRLRPGQHHRRPRDRRRRPKVGRHRAHPPRGHQARPGPADPGRELPQARSPRWPTGSIGYAAHELDNEAVDRIAVDAQRAFAGADIAFLNPGNTRSDIDAGPITYSDAFEVQAYEHPVWRMRHAGQRPDRRLEADQPGLLVSGPSRAAPGRRLHGRRQRHRGRAARPSTTGPIARRSAPTSRRWWPGWSATGASSPLTPAAAA